MNTIPIKLSVPFIPDAGYADFLSEHAGCLSSLYFPLTSGPVLDSRIRLCQDPGTATCKLADTLSPLTAVDKYILMNTRFTEPDVYRDTARLTAMLDAVARLDKAVGLKGIVITDAYLLNALDRTGHDIIPRLEAVPGINAMPDSPEKCIAFFDLISQTRFNLPSRIVTDRSLNRDIQSLSFFCDVVKARYPGIRIELLANEGCIYHCPFKLSHDAQISLSNTGLVRENTWQLNQEIGCQAYFTQTPHAFLKSPFIRPEDTDRYNGLSDGIKLCGRTRGVNFLKQCITAYIHKRFEGNLLDLMDAPQMLAQRYHIDNARLGPDFFTTLTSCTKACKTCNICFDLFSQTTWKKEKLLTSYKEFQ